MIAIARKRKQNSAYTTKGEARPVIRRGPRPFGGCQCQKILPVVRVNDDTPISLKGVSKTRNKDAGEKDAKRTFCFRGWQLATGH
jgi:hypothetical protein